MLQRGRALAGASGDGMASLDLAVIESDALLKVGQFESAADVAMRGLRAAHQAGLEACHLAGILAGNAPRRCSPAGARPRRRR